ncbi:2-hydroxyacid dehydrogenase [Ancylobacter mangrovi]|uniref:2-hydroxyacid dehydrogenase n=1 Tax=Ancylobacter mangrovi TaxID=2972472 RepID=UPI002161A0BE|nr:2-hydroxyacid dehydrogenase [Ancylobacter mangrovi]MCS0500822.1 2-hydroxyacid dehydrogenase [Ancylobacter mangrovi]
MTSLFPDICVLVPSGVLHSHAVERIGEQFRLVRTERPDTALLAPEVVRSIRGVAAAMTPLDAAFIDSLPNLEIISYFGMGYEAVDARHAATRGIVVTNTPEVMNEEVADVAVGLLLSCVREFGPAEAWLRSGRWEREGNYPLSAATLRGRSIGIFGMGRIGTAIARRLAAFDVPIAYHNRSPNPAVPYAYHPSLMELAKAVDTLVCVAPGGPATEKAINAGVLEALGPDGVVVNVGRGSTIDEEALAAALHKGVIRGAALDVFADEPHVPSALLDAPNTVLLPHIASASQRTRRAVADLCVDNLVSWFGRGVPLTPVPEAAHLPARGDRVG